VDTHLTTAQGVFSIEQRTRTAFRTIDTEEKLMGILDKIFDRKGDKPAEPRPDFSNVRSDGSSTAPSAAPAPQPTAPIGSGRTGSEKTYVVVKGDSLSKIALREYGDANKWRTIYEANKDRIKDPDLIYPGQELKVPGA
jgi:nucleoid-associated protein YgaU